jgi:hypothetical protein
MINQINVPYRKTNTFQVNALLRNRYPEHKGFLITLDEDQRTKDMCTINVLYENEGEMVVFAPTELQLNGQIHYFKSLNSHATCTTRTPEVAFGKVYNGYSTVLRFTF